MNKKIDDLGRLVIPKEMRKQLEIKEGDPVNISMEDDKIIITNAKADYKKDVLEEAADYIKNNSDIKKVYQFINVKELLEIIEKGF